MVTTVGAEGVLDTGASRTVIGDKRVKQLLQGLSKECRDNARKVASDVKFRFGNSGTLSSKHAMLLLASDSSWVRVEVIPGNTPLLISNRLLRDLDAVIHVRDSFVQVGERRARTYFDDKGLTIIDIAELLHVPHSRVFLSESQHHPRETSQPLQQHTEHVTQASTSEKEIAAKSCSSTRRSFEPNQPRSAQSLTPVLPTPPATSSASHHAESVNHEAGRRHVGGGAIGSGNLCEREGGSVCENGGK